MAAANEASLGGRAWRRMRLALLWARRGSAAHSLRLLRALRHGGGRDDRLRYGEREFSIDETPAFRFRTPSARVLRFIPCMAPAAPDTPAGDYYGEDRYFFAGARRERDAGYYGGETSGCGTDDDQLPERAMMDASEDAGVDVKAEEFIAKFHAQMRLQRQISWLQYNEMMQRSIC